MICNYTYISCSKPAKNRQITPVRAAREVFDVPRGTLILWSGSTIHYLQQNLQMTELEEHSLEQ